MKVFILFILFISFFTSCTKQIDVKPAPVNIAVTPPKTTTDTTGKIKPDTTIKIIMMILFIWPRSI